MIVSTNFVGENFCRGIFSPGKIFVTCKKFRHFSPTNIFPRELKIEYIEYIYSLSESDTTTGISPDKSISVSSLSLPPRARRHCLNP